MTRTGSLLVVDDNEANRDALSRRLRHRGYVVSVAADGAEALALTETADIRSRPAGRRDARHERTRGPQPDSRRITPTPSFP